MKPALLFLLLAAQVPIFSQMGGSGIPWPHRHKKEESKDLPTQRSLGKLTKVDDQSLVVEVPDGRVLTFKRSEKTQFFRDEKEIKPAELKVGDRVTVEATEDQEGFLYAVKVSVDTNPPPEEEEGAAAPAPAETKTATGGRGEGNSAAPVDDNAEPGPPRLKRGIPAHGQDADTEEEAAAAPPPPPPPPPPPALRRRRARRGRRPRRPRRRPPTTR